jgi:hypothetical protein
MSSDSQARKENLSTRKLTYSLVRFVLYLSCLVKYDRDQLALGKTWRVEIPVEAYWLCLPHYEVVNKTRFDCFSWILD